MQVNLEQTAVISLDGLENQSIWAKKIQLSDLSAKYTDFWQLWKQYQDYFYSRCLKWMGGNSHDAEDLLSRAMLKAWNQWPDYGGKIPNPKAWFSRLIHNLSVDLHRERQREREITDDVVDIPSLESPESEILRHELEAYLWQCIESLPPKLRDPFILRCCQNKSYRDIAKELTLSQDNVWKRVQQARTILRNRLNKYFLGEDDTCLDFPSFNKVNSTNPLQQKQHHHVETLYATSLQPIVNRSQINNLKLTSDWEASITTGNIVEEINYQVAVICLETLPHNWYSSPIPLGWS